MRPLDRPLHARLGIEAIPKRAGGALFAGAEESPAHAAFVVLRARESQRREIHKSLAVRSDRVLGPERIVAQLVLRDAVRWLVAPEMVKSCDQLASDQRQARLQLEGFFKLGDMPAVVVLFVEEDWVDRAIGFAAQARRRHKL